jgi:hypothetical protein
VAGVSLLAEDPLQHVDSHGGASFPDVVARGDLSPEMGDDIENHGCFGYFYRMDQSCTVFELLASPEDDDSQAGIPTRVRGEAMPSDWTVDTLSRFIARKSLGWVREIRGAGGRVDTFDTLPDSRETSWQNISTMEEVRF